MGMGGWVGVGSLVGKWVIWVRRLMRRLAGRQSPRTDTTTRRKPFSVQRYAVAGKRLHGGIAGGWEGGAGCGVHR